MYMENPVYFVSLKFEEFLLFWKRNMYTIKESHSWYVKRNRDEECEAGESVIRFTNKEDVPMSMDDFFRANLGSQ